MIISILMLLTGFTVLILGADWLVKGASSLAKRLNVPQIVIGLTIVAFGTSTPEMIVNIFASAKGATDISFGNIIGSNNFNILINLGICALIYPLDVKKTTARREIPFAILASVLLLFLVNDQWFNPSAVNELSRWNGILLLGLFILFLVYTHNLARKGSEVLSHVQTFPLLKIFGLIAFGLAGLILGGNLVVKHAILIAIHFGISEKIIGLTIVAAGTSLPELATSAVAVWKKNPDIAIGNIVGSNIFNLLLVMGVSSIIRPLGYNISFNLDQYVMIFAVLTLFLLMLNTKKNRLDRWEGTLLIIIYVLYAVFMLK